MSDNILEVKSLKKYFTLGNSLFKKQEGMVKAVDSVSFNIERGSIYGLVGESGCGKSTTGRTLLNLIEPTGGSVDFNGETLFNVEENIRVSKDRLLTLRKDMQIIFQDPFSSLNPKRKIVQTITEGMIKHNIYSKSEVYERGEELLKVCGLSKDSLSKYPFEFSGGQRQRIGIARALSVNPKFIVCDEPIAALDISIQSQILNLLEKLKEDLSLSYLFISHDLRVVNSFCDKVGVMYLGALVEEGDSSEIFKNPMHPYTKALFSAIPKRSIDENKKRIILVGEIPSPKNPPSGCKFHTRCPYKKPICTEEAPKFLEIKEGHRVACHRVLEI